MARPHPTLAVADSDRTLILQRRGRCNTNSKRSAYFADSDSSSACGELPPPAVKPAARTPASAAATATGSSGGLSRTGGRWILEGIRHSQQGLGRETQTIKDEQDRAPVFYGSVRFPASRVALWYEHHVRLDLYVRSIHILRSSWGWYCCPLTISFETYP